MTEQFAIRNLQLWRKVSIDLFRVQAPTNLIANCQLRIGDDTSPKQVSECLNAFRPLVSLELGIGEGQENQLQEILPDERISAQEYVVLVVRFPQNCACGGRQRRRGAEERFVQVLSPLPPC
ncbi:sigma-70 domain-containing protein [Nostoc sp. UIC 10890]